MVGLAAWIGLWAAWLYFGIKAFKGSSGNDRTYVWAILVATATIAVHALIDFDLSLGAVSIALWFGFGIVSGLTQIEAPVHERTLGPRDKKRTEIIDTATMFF